MLQNLFCQTALFLSSLTADLPPPPPDSLYEITAETIYGAKVPLSGYKGRVLLIVNIVTSGPLVKQLAELESLYNTFSEDGLSVLAFPSNDFISGQAMTLDQVKQYCQVTSPVSFPVFSITHVMGSYKNPVYQFLTNTRTNPMYGGDVSWNFVKFLVSRDGKVIGRFSSNISPEDAKIKEAIKKAM